MLLFVFCAFLCYNELNSKKVVKFVLKYKINVLQALKEKGFTAYKLRKENIFGGAVVQAFRNGEIVSIHSLHTVCKLLNCQLSDIVEYIPDAK